MVEAGRVGDGGRGEVARLGFGHHDGVHLECKMEFGDEARGFDFPFTLRRSRGRRAISLIRQSLVITSPGEEGGGEGGGAGDLPTRVTEPQTDLG